MNLIDEAVILEIFGIRMYAFGLYVSLGTLAAMVVLAICGRVLRLKSGTVPLTALCAIVSGALISRLAFCLMNRELGRITPLSFWPQLNGGGWSLFGLICGVYLGGLISAKIAGEKVGKIMDSLSLAMLPLIVAERMGENRIEDFDISRPLDSTFLKGTFLTVDEGEPCLATYYVAAIVAAALFITLAIRFLRKEKDGSLTVAFLLLFGAASIITESLRYDRFLSVSFVGLQQVAAAIMLGLGVALAIRRSGRPQSAVSILAAISIPLFVVIVIGLEFALDRTTWNKILIYLGMILTVSIPAGLGLKLLSMEKGAKDE